MSQNSFSRSKRNSPIPMILVGAGLIFVAVAAMIFLPKEIGPTQIGNDLGFSPATVNYPAPDLNLTDVSGNPVSLADYRGQVVLVNNWATWCPPCKAEMPDLEAYFKAHKSDGFTLIGISAGDTQEQVAGFTQAYGITFPMWLDPLESALAAFNTMNLPSSFVIDAGGTVRLAWTGAISLENLEKYVTPMLNK